MIAKVWALRLGLVVALIGGWVYLTGPGGVSPILLPRIGLVWVSLVGFVGDAHLWSSLLQTVGEILGAFAISVVFGVTVGFLCSRTSLRIRVAEPLIAWGYMAPLVLFYPLVILWFDIGFWSKIFYAALSGFFPVAFNSLRGFAAVDTRFLRVARAFGASPSQTDRLVKVQAALPMVLSGIRLGAALSIIGVVLAEMLASRGGLGYDLALASQTLRTPDVFALILILLVLVAVLQLIIQRVGRTRREE